MNAAEQYLANRIGQLELAVANLLEHGAQKDKQIAGLQALLAKKDEPAPPPDE